MTIILKIKKTATFLELNLILKCSVDRVLTESLKIKIKTAE